MDFYNKADLARRWNVSRQVIQNWVVRHADFPKEVYLFSDSKKGVYAEADVLNYEAKRNLLPQFADQEKMSIHDFQKIVKKLSKDDRGAVLEMLVASLGENLFMKHFQKALEGAEIKIKRG